MTIAEMRERSNRVLAPLPTDLIFVAVVLLFSTASFGLGMLTEKELATRAGEGSGAEKGGFWIEDVASSTSVALPAAALTSVSRSATAPKVVAPKSIPVVPPGSVVAPKEGKYVASKSGTKYYLPSCSGVKRIKEENKVWFASVEDAQAAGLSPAANCPGL